MTKIHLSTIQKSNNSPIKKNGHKREPSNLSSDSDEITKSDFTGHFRRYAPSKIEYTEEDLIKYSKSNDEKVLWVIQILSKEANLEWSDLSRYTYNLIREYLVLNESDVIKTAKIIASDILWREDKLPIDPKSLSGVLKSERMYLYGSDKQMNPWIYFKPYGKLGQYYTNQANLSNNEYLDYLVYCFEWLNNIEGYNDKFTILADYSGYAINIKQIGTIHKMITNHYPDKI